MEEDKENIAQKHNITLNALYCKIKRIRKKLLSNLDDNKKKTYM